MDTRAYDLQRLLPAVLVASVALLLRGSVLVADAGAGAELGLGVLGLALVGHVGVVAVLPVGGVADDLQTAVGQLHAVLAGDDVAVGHLVAAVVGAVVVVLDGVVEVVGHAGLVVVVVL